MTAPAEKSYSLIDLLLAEQQDMSAVERFSRAHESSEVPEGHPRYRELMPLSRPRVGEQYAFVVDLDRCSGCKACVSACHSLNGLDENEMWRGTGLIVGESPASAARGSSAYQQTITAACHHCVEPACAEGCPVLAYEKDAGTGIVRHLDDQCIGCQYCVLKCPYDVPKFSAKHGIVRKCDMCYGRIAAGEPPACVQACPHDAIRIEIVDQQVVRASSSPGDKMVPGAFDSILTLPTTRYQSSRRVPRNARAVDADVLELQPAHWPLIVMLLATQMAAGLHLTATAILLSRGEAFPVLNRLATVALLSGLAASIFHLGRPLKAWRVFLGWRRSWMSREIVVFSGYAAFASWGAIMQAGTWHGVATALLALLSILCSAMIYIDTPRSAWASRIVFPRFFGTVLLLGSTGAAMVSGWAAPHLTIALLGAAIIVRTVLFVWENATMLNAYRLAESPSHRAARTAVRLLPHLLAARVALFLLSTVFALFALANVWNMRQAWGAASFAATVCSAILERYLFFTTVNAPRMPGGVPA